MKRHFVLILIIGMLLTICWSSCKKHYDNYQITDVIIQRVEIEGMPMQDSVLYLVKPVAEYFYSYEFFLNQSCGTMAGSVEMIDTIIVEDARGESLNEGFLPMNVYKGKTLEKMYLVSLGNKSSGEVKIYWSGETLREWMQEGERMPFYTYKLYSINRNYPVPENIMVQFPNRVIRAKVDNEAMHYKIEGVGFDL